MRPSCASECRSIHRVTLAFAVGLALLLIGGTAWAQGTLPVPEGEDGATPDEQPGEPGARASEERNDVLEGQHGWLGLYLKMTTNEEATKMGYAQPLIRVEQVFEGSPAELSGFQAGDYVVGYRGEPVFDVNELVERVKATPPGTKVTVKRVRGSDKDDAKTEEVPLLLGVRPDSYQMLVDHFVDKQAPELTAHEVSTSDSVELAAHEGDVVVLDFWATWCGPCRKTLPHLAELHRTKKDEGLTIIGVSDEDDEVLEGFLEENPLPYTIAVDEDRETSGEYLINSYPTMYIVDREGIVRHVFIGAAKMDEIDAAIADLLEE